MQCPKCLGKKKIGIQKPVTMTEMGWEEKECDLCGGTGEIYEDLTPRLISGLDEIKEILLRIEKLLSGGK